MKKVNEISIEEIKEVFSKCKSNKEVLEYYGYKQNGSGQRFLNAIREKAEIDFHDYFNHITNREHYEKKPKTCVACGCILPYEKRYNKFCSSNCAAVYNNVKRGKRPIETRVKISEALKKRPINEEEIKKRIQEIKNNPEKKCLNCGKVIKRGDFCNKACSVEYKRKSKIEQWLQGKVFTRGNGQLPEFIKQYLFKMHNNKCEKCGWGEINETTGKIPLEIHHIDGDCTNNKIENLQLLCPNCHSLTSNFGSLNKDSKRFHRKKLKVADIDN